MNNKLFNHLSVLILSAFPLLLEAQDVSSRIDRISRSIMTPLYSIGLLSMIIGIGLGMTSERYGWSWFTRSCIGVFLLGLVHALHVLIKG